MNIINWKKIWKDKTISENILSNDNNSIFKRLLIADGFDGLLGNISADSWIDYLLNIESMLTPCKSVFEVGCGSGALLFYFFNKGYIIGGIDYSEKLLDLAKQYLIGADLSVEEAINLDLKKFDVVISNSVFQYFESYLYAEEVIKKMYEKANKMILILDVPDFKLSLESEKHRSNTIENFEESYRNLKHLYYEKSWFLKFAEERNCNIYIYNQNIRNYNNNKYRYNCILYKN